MTCDTCDKPATCVMVRQIGNWRSIENGLGLDEACHYACDEHCDHEWCDLIDD